MSGFMNAMFIMIVRGGGGGGEGREGMGRHCWEERGERGFLTLSVSLSFLPSPFPSSAETWGLEVGKKRLIFGNSIHTSLSPCYVWLLLHIDNEDMIS